MPVHRYKAVLHGGRKERHVEIHVPEKSRGGGNEGTIFYVDIVSKSKAGRERAVKMVEKRFHKVNLDQLNFGNPWNQFYAIQDLARLNREKKLGLRLPATVRLRIGGDVPGLIISRLNVVDAHRLTPKQKEAYTKDAQRQIKIARKHGYHLGHEFLTDVFRPVRQGNKVVAVISDFGNVRKSL